MKTVEPFIICTNCRTKTGSYYVDLRFKGEVCCQCLVQACGGQFPKGKGCHVPCKLCESPDIHWYERKTYGRMKKDCGRHDVFDGKDDDDSHGLFD